jgi:hypothetical protein
MGLVYKGGYMKLRPAAGWNVFLPNAAGNWEHLLREAQPGGVTKER